MSKSRTALHGYKSDILQAYVYKENGKRDHEGAKLILTLKHGMASRTVLENDSAAFAAPESQEFSYR